MKQISLLLIISLIASSVKGQKVKLYTPPPYWTVWFTLNDISKEFTAHYDSTKCFSCDSLEYVKHSEWVQSFDDSAEAYRYYRDIKITGKVLIWHKYENGVDTSTVWIDKYSIVLHKYLNIKQP
jgi:hypothetical protein